MKIRIAILAAFTACLICAPCPTPARQKTAQSAQRYPKDNKRPSEPSPSTVPNAKENASQYSANQNGGAVTDNPDVKAVRIVGFPKRSTGETVTLICTIVLTLAGIAGIIVAICTLFKIRDQASETAKSAKAASDTVGILIDSERAWLMGDKIDTVPPRDPKEERATYWMSVPIKNFGKSVARIFECAVDRKIYSGLPPTPEYPKESPCDVVVVPGGIHRLWFGMRPPDIDFVRGRTGASLLYVFGYVKYRSIGNIERESRFCYFYQVPDAYAPDPEGFYTCGNAPQSYTKCT